MRLFYFLYLITIYFFPPEADFSFVLPKEKSGKENATKERAFYKDALSLESLLRDKNKADITLLPTNPATRAVIGFDSSATVRALRPAAVGVESLHRIKAFPGWGSLWC